MVDPVSVIVGAITSLILPKAAEKFGEKLGDVTLEKSAALVQAARQAVHNKLEKSNSVGLLTRAEEKPTEHNIRVLEAEIIGQVEDDPQFAAQLEALVDQASRQSSSFQIFLDGLRAKTLELDKLSQVSEGKDKSEQIGGRNWQVQNVKIGDVSMESRNDS
ncbi:MAG: Fis family transcriptional regulator [Stenomitos rutilans HA7619-LM2]|jgi:hypothetical protein|nr:Fis family transcriptional regulator [Stenomitos rutilans HA7619-LM2]